jgi:hypothetical protein
MKPVRLPQPLRIRRIDGSFAWIDHRLIREGFLPRMSLHDQAVYLFLILAADAQGVSFYRKEKICDALGLDWSEFEQTKARLIQMDLLAFASDTANSPNGVYQVLPVGTAQAVPA